MLIRVRYAVQLDAESPTAFVAAFFFNEFVLGLSLTVKTRAIG